METIGTIFDLKRFTIHDGPGIRSTVFFKGCPLDCWWCHNPESRCPDIESMPNRWGADDLPNKNHESYLGCRVTAETVFHEIIQDVPFYDNSGGGATFSGGEPIFQIEFLTELLRMCKEWGIHTAVDTCGYAPEENFERIYPLTDLFLFDFKLIDETEHIKYTGVSNRTILTNLKMLADKGGDINIRIPMIPGITDTWDNLKGMGAFLKDLESIRKISLLPYNKLGEDKRERYHISGRLPHFETQNKSDLEEKSGYFRALGYDVQIGG